MTAAELKALRETLGLPIAWLATKAGVLDAQVATAVRQIVEAYTSASIKPDEMVMLKYRSDADLWQYRQDMQGLPATFHAAMLHKASYALQASGASVLFGFFLDSCLGNMEKIAIVAGCWRIEYLRRK
jgi:hypothetical protein